MDEPKNWEQEAGTPSPTVKLVTDKVLLRTAGLPTLNALPVEIGPTTLKEFPNRTNDRAEKNKEILIGRHSNSPVVPLLH
jgi:hypothetical protein